LPAKKQSSARGAAQKGRRRRRPAGIAERAFALVGRMVRVGPVMVVVALIVAGLGVWGIARLPTAFIPNEDQGYVLVGVQLPDGASLERTASTLRAASQIAQDTPGVDQVIAIAGTSILDDSTTLANAGLAYVVFKDWSVRGKAKGQDLRSIEEHLQARLRTLPDGTGFVLVPPPIQGIGNAGGFTMQVEQRDGSFDYQKLFSVTNEIIETGNSQSGLQHLITSFRPDVPQIRVIVDRSKAESLGVSVGDVFSALASYLGSSFVNQFNKFGLSLQVYVQADSSYRLQPDDLLKLYVRSQYGNMVPVGTLAQIQTVVGPSLISLFNLYLSSTISGSPAPGFSSGQALALMENIANQNPKDHPRALTRRHPGAAPAPRRARPRGDCCLYLHHHPFGCFSPDRNYQALV
jgi:HAE1 family hydrophobic/amphiphilic exporter-1